MFKSKRIISLVLTLVMMFSMVPAEAFAASGASLCEHHSEHVDCGYVPAYAGSPCTHQHDESCYADVAACMHVHIDCGYIAAIPGTACQHICDGSCGYSEGSAEVPCACVPAEDGSFAHAEGCGYVAAVPGTPCQHVCDGSCGYSEGSAEVPCGHVCSADTGCVTNQLICQHVHDEFCGFAAAVNEVPCGFECSDCAAAEPTPEATAEPSESPEPSVEPTESPDPTEESETKQGIIYLTADEWYDNDELYAAYIENLFYNYGISMFGSAAGERLTGDARTVYNSIKPMLAQVASGARSSTVFDISCDFYIDADIEDEMHNKVGAIAVSVFEALRHDCPYDMYWAGLKYACGYSYNELVDGGYNLTKLSFHISVSDMYATGEPDASGCYYSFNTAHATGAVAAANNAKNIVSANAGLSDYEKLLAYKDKICQLVDYDYNGLENSNNNDLYAHQNIATWQLINVFDNNTNTNVVCEGYAEAFQYLCDLSTFNGNVACYTIQGHAGQDDEVGGHEWNIVNINGASYHVDVTWCDTIGGNSFFMVGGSGSPSYGYYIKGSYYYYDNPVINLWGSDASSILTLSATDYDPSANSSSGIAINASSFPYAALREKALELDSNGDSKLSEDEAAVLTELNLGLSECSSLKGIEHFPNLISLQCGVGCDWVEGRAYVSLSKLFGEENIDKISNVSCEYMEWFDTDTGSVALNIYEGDSNPGSAWISCCYDNGAAQEGTLLSVSLYADTSYKCPHERLQFNKAHYSECSGGVLHDFYKCLSCGQLFRDANATDTNVDFRDGNGQHDMDPTPRNPFVSSCMGGIDVVWYECKICREGFSNPEGTERPEYIQGDGKHNLVLRPANYVACNGGFKTEWYHCTLCDNAFTDESASEFRQRAAGNGRHDPTLQAPTFTECGGGIKDEWYLCRSCGYGFADKACTKYAFGYYGNGQHSYSELRPADFSTAPCLRHILIDHYMCEVCHGFFSDTSGSGIDESYIVRATSSHKLVNKTLPAVPATETEFGLKAITVKYCSVCQLYQHPVDGGMYGEEGIHVWRRQEESQRSYAKASLVEIYYKEASDAEENVISGGTESIDLTDIHNAESGAWQKALRATVSPVKTVSSQKVNWKSSSTAIATVDAEGVVTFKKPGTVSITATATDGSGKTASVKFDVKYKGTSTADKFTAKLPAESLKYAQPINIGLQIGDTVKLDVFGTDKSTALNSTLFDYISSNNAVATVDTDGVITGVNPGSATITAKFSDDPLARSCKLTVKVIAQQTAIGTVQLTADTNALPEGVSAEGSILSMAKGQESFSFVLTPSAKTTSGDDRKLDKGSYTWKSSDTKIATFKENTDGTAMVTVKGNVDGICTISATTKDLAKAAASFTIYVKDYSPRLGAASISLDTQKTNSVQLPLVESYGNTIDGDSIRFYDADYDSSSKTYNGTTGRIVVDEYDAETGTLSLSASGYINNSSIKGQLSVTTADKTEYRYNLTVAIKNTAPSISTKQTGKFNLFYLDSEAVISLTAKNEQIEWARIDSSYFECSEYDADSSSVTVRYKAQLPGTSPNTKLTLLVKLAGYANPVEKAVTLSTENKGPSLILDPGKGVITNDLGFCMNSMCFHLIDKASGLPIEMSKKDSLTASYGEEALQVTVSHDFFNISPTDTQLKNIKSGKLSIAYKAETWLKAVNYSFSFTVKNTIPVLKPAANTLTLNTMRPNISFSTLCSFEQFNVNSFIKIEDAVLTPAMKGTDADKLELVFDGDARTITACIKPVLDDNDKLIGFKSVKPGSYTFSFTPKVKDLQTGETHSLKSVSMTVKVISQIPTAKLSLSTFTLNNVYTMHGMEADIITSGDNLTPYKFVQIVGKTAKEQALLDSGVLGIGTYNDDTRIGMSFPGKDYSNAPETGTYNFIVKVRAQLSSNNAVTKELPLKVNVVNTVPKVSLSSSTVNLNLEYKGSETASTQLKIGGDFKIAGFRLADDQMSSSFSNTIINDYDDNAKFFSGDTVKIRLNGQNSYTAGSYKIKLIPIAECVCINENCHEQEALAPVTLTLRINKAASAAATVSASGKLDMIQRETSAITYTITKLTNVVGDVMQVNLIGQDAAMFQLASNKPVLNAKGQPTVELKLIESAEYSTKDTYKVKLSITLDSGIVVNTGELSVKVANTAIKLKTPAAQTVYQSQSTTRALLYTVELTSPVSARIGSVSLGDIPAQLQQALTKNSATFDLSADGRYLTVRVLFKDTSALSAGKTYTLPLLIKAEGCDPLNTKDVKVNLSIKTAK